jgi:hypothetical protein
VKDTANFIIGLIFAFLAIMFVAFVIWFWIGV